ncbi:MAG: helix-turn-helix transcriptional regulator [Alphaproteobacteria bacterium]|nr:helix-turn-helix transcriptional regulator [Alphaproteobacteria bacterium]
MISARQLKAARLLADLDQRQLAERSGVSLPTIQRMEKLGLERSSAGNVEKVRMALEGAGIVFIESGAASPGGGEGVRMAGE